ncbi:hypothetical protein AB6D11_19095 [Vibrio splendidus]
MRPSFAPGSMLTFMWDMNLRIMSVERDDLDTERMTALNDVAIFQGIDVHVLDFADYASLEEAMATPEGTLLVAAMNQSSRKVLIWLLNCDALAPLSVVFTYALRETLTARVDNCVQTIFVAQRTSLKRLFEHPDSAFYRSHYKLILRDMPKSL